MKARDRRNLNPTAEAVAAMHLWGENYGRHNGGSMDFWDGLSDAGKRRCKELVDAIRDADKRHQVR